MLENSAVSTLFLLAATMLGCSDATDATDATGAAEGATDAHRSQASAVIRGDASGEDLDAVVLVGAMSAAGPGLCTGTLVAPNVVLTARHCVSQTGDGGFACLEDGTLVSATGTNGGKILADYRADRLTVFTGAKRPAFNGPPPVAARGKAIVHDGATSICGHDLALIVLDRNIEGAKILPVRLDAPIRAGELVTAVGYGATESVNLPSTRQQRSGIEVLRVGPFAGNGRESPVPSNDFVVGESICQGDSGGPAISEETNAVIGVVSRGGNGVFPPSDGSTPPLGTYCTGAATRNFYTKVSAFKDVFAEAFAQAGAAMWVEGAARPCTADSQCASGVCADDGNGKKACAGSCSSDAQCADGQTCDLAASLCKNASAQKATVVTRTTPGCSAARGEQRGEPWGPLVAACTAGIVGLLRTRARSDRKKKR